LKPGTRLGRRQEEHHGISSTDRPSRRGRHGRASLALSILAAIVGSLFAVVTDAIPAGAVTSFAYAPMTTAAP